MNGDNGYEGLAAVKRFVALDNNKRDLKNMLAEVQTDLNAAHDAVLAYFESHAQEGLSQIKIMSRTVSLRRDLRASAKNVETLAEYKDTAFLVKSTVNANTLGAWVREQDAGPDGMPVLPEAVRNAINVTEQFSVRVTKT